MDYTFTESPSGSPIMTTFSPAHSLYSTSEASSPRSPHLVRESRRRGGAAVADDLVQDVNTAMFNNPLSYGMFPYGTNPSPFYGVPPGRIPVEYAGSSTLDDQDRRRRRTSTASSKDKEAVPNMHLVGRRM